MQHLQIIVWTYGDTRELTRHDGCCVCAHASYVYILTGCGAVTQREARQFGHLQCDGRQIQDFRPALPSLSTWLSHNGQQSAANQSVAVRTYEFDHVRCTPMHSRQ